jgi:hypothetical protein
MNRPWLTGSLKERTVNPVEIQQRVRSCLTPFLFEPNDDITRRRVARVIEESLRTTVIDYRVVCDSTNNQPDTRDLQVDLSLSETGVQ